MRRLVLSLGLLLVAVPAYAVDQPGKVVRETWDAAFLEGGRAGFTHTVVREVEQDGQKQFHTMSELQLTLKRGADTIELGMQTGTIETAEGKVLGVSMRQLLGKQQTLILTGVVRGNQLHVKVDGQMKLERDIPWNDDVIGLYKQELLPKDRKVKPGDAFSYQSFEPTVMTVLTTRVAVKDYESVDVLGVRKRLLRVESQPDKVDDGTGTKVPLPAMISWLDKDLETVRSSAEMPLLGKLILVRTTAEKAKTTAAARLASGGAKLPNLLESSLFPLDRAIPDAYNTTSVIYRITLPKDDDPTTAFKQDDRQQVQNVQGHSFELVVKARRGPAAAAGTAPQPGAEFLESNYFVNCSDAKVRERARQAVGSEKDPWKKALKVERYVYEKMDRKNYSEAFATSDQVARTMEGDCTEHAVLAAALCRAVDVPARTAVGFVYVDLPGKGPHMGFHMWAEVWINGQWLPIDGTLGRGFVGASHIKITDPSWHNEQSLKPLLPVLRVMQGKPTIEVVRTDGKVTR